MDLVDFIITNAKAAGLDDDEIGGILQSASRKLSGNIPEDKWEEQIMTWINTRAKKNRNSNEVKEEENER